MVVNISSRQPINENNPTVRHIEWIISLKQNSTALNG